MSRVILNIKLYENYQESTAFRERLLREKYEFVMHPNFSAKFLGLVIAFSKPCKSMLLLMVSHSNVR